MARANNIWEREEAIAHADDLFDAAESQSPQTVTAANGHFLLTFHQNSKRMNAAEFLAAGGPLDDGE